MKNLKNVEFIPKNGKNCLRYIVKVEGNQYIITDWMYDIIEMIVCNFDTDIISEHINRVLKIAKGKIGGSNGAAELLGINVSTLRHRMKKLNILFGRDT